MANRIVGAQAETTDLATQHESERYGQHDELLPGWVDVVAAKCPISIHVALESEWLFLIG